METKNRSLKRWLENPGWRGKVGFIAPPGFSVGPMDFLRIAPEGFAVMQAMTHIPNFQVHTAQIAEGVSQLEDAAMALKDSTMDIVSQSGTPFSFAHEGGLRFAQDLHARIEKAIGIPFSMMGLALLNALKKMGYSSVAVACTYYEDELSRKYTDFLRDAGLKVLVMENWISQGLYGSYEEVLDDRGRYTIGQIYKAARLVADRAPNADCIVISGGGVYTMDVLEALEEDLRMPVISDMSAQFWEIFVRLGVWPTIKGRGSLLASLEKGP